MQRYTKFDINTQNHLSAYQDYISWFLLYMIKTKKDLPTDSPFKRPSAKRSLSILKEGIRGIHQQGILGKHMVHTLGPNISPENRPSQKETRIPTNRISRDFPSLRIVHDLG